MDGLHFLGVPARPDAGFAAPGAGGQRRRAGRYRAGAGEPALPLRDQRQQSALEAAARRSEEHTSELQSLMRISYAVFCLKKKNITSKQLRSSANSTEAEQTHK